MRVASKTPPGLCLAALAALLAAFCFRACSNSPSGSIHEGAAKLDEAIQLQIKLQGTNALSRLLSLIAAHDSSAKRHLIALAEKQKLMSMKFISDRERHE